MYVVRNNFQLKNTSVEYHGPSHVGVYRIENVSFLSLDNDGDRRDIVILIQLGRDFRSIFLVTYLPTLLINIINLATNYLDYRDHLEAIITVNITSLMVLSALFISVSGSLPATSGIKNVDVWLLSSLIFPFMIILLNVLIFLLNGRILKQVTSVQSGVRKATEAAVNTYIPLLIYYGMPILYLGFIICYFVIGICYV